MGRRPTTPLEETAFGKRLREIRKRRGMTQSELAAKLGLQQSMIAQYERGYIRLNAAGLIVRLVEALDTTPNELLGADALQTESVIRNRALLRRLRHVDRLPQADQKALVRFLDALLARHKVEGTLERQSRSAQPVAGRARKRTSPKRVA